MDITPDNFYPSPRVMSSMIKMIHKIDFNDDIYNFFKKMYLLKHKKIKNCIVETLISINYCSTQREAKQVVKILNLSNELLEKKFETCSNKELLSLYNIVEEKIYEKN